jgi:uncharacterized protein (DUF849 family)
MIMVAPNGARRSKADHPALPMTAEETAADAAKCREAGASVVHLHVRDESGAHVLDAERYRQATAAIERATAGDMTVQITTEAVGRYTPEQQMEVVREVKPVSVSVALRELAPDDGHSQVLRSFCVWMQVNRIAPQFILYDADDAMRFIALRDADVIPYTNPFVLFALGRYADDQQSQPKDLEPFLAALGGRDIPWSVCAFGGRELACAEAAVAAGGHVRIGFENNLHMPDGTVAGSNADLIAATAARIRTLGLEVMSAAEAREFLAETLV